MVSDAFVNQHIWLFWLVPFVLMLSSAILIVRLADQSPIFAMVASFNPISLAIAFYLSVDLLLVIGAIAACSGVYMLVRLIWLFKHTAFKTA